VNEWRCTIDGLTWAGWLRQGEGPKLVSIHGWLDNANTFVPLSEEMPGFQWLSLDLLGHGLSQWLPEYAGPYHFSETVHRLANLLSYLPDKYWLVGHSLGAGLSTLLASLVPEKIEKLILLDGLGPLTSPDQEAHQLFLRSRQKRSNERRYYPCRDEALARLEKQGHTRRQAELLAQRSLFAHPEGFAFDYDPRLREISRLRMTETQIRSFIAQIDLPVQVQRYSLGFLPKIEPAQERFQLLKQAHWCEIEGSHHCHMQEPKKVAEAILQWAH